METIKELLDIRFIMLVIAVLLFCILQQFFAKQKRMRLIRENEKRKKQAEDENKRLTDSVNKRITELNKLAQSIMMRAIRYGDEVTPERVDEVINAVRVDVDTFHSYDPLMNSIEDGIKKLRSIERDMEAHEKELEEYRKEQQADRERYEKKHPYLNTKYFATCTDISEVKRMFHRLAKVYHPDNPGGSAEMFRAIRQEYNSITGR